MGHDAARCAFDKLVSAEGPASAIERASFLFGMQTFCRRQLKHELSAAMHALDGSEQQPEEFRYDELVS